MTHTDINMFLSSITEAKRALDAEPGYQQTIRLLREDNGKLGETIAKRELHIHELKNEVSSLTSKLREVEAERNDAGFRLLESDDKVQALLRDVHGVVKTLLGTVAAVEGGEELVVVKASEKDELSNLRLDAAHELERNAKLEAQLAEIRDSRDQIHSELQGLKANLSLAHEQLSPRPFAPEAGSAQGDATGSSTGEMKSSPIKPDNDYDWKDATDQYKTTGESVVDPMPSTTKETSSYSASGSTESSQAVGPQEGQSDGPFASQDLPNSRPENVSSISVVNEGNAASPASQPERNRDPATRYAGRKYYDVTYYVPYHDWIAGGGTEADYHWRPEAMRSSQS